MSSPVELVQLAFDLKQESARICAERAARITNPGLSALVRSVAEQERDQAMALRDLIRRGDLERAFSSEGEAVEAIPRGPSAPASGETLDFLEFVMRFLERSAALYAGLERRAQLGDARAVFRRLADETQRMSAMVSNRYDLETLGAGG